MIIVNCEYKFYLSFKQVGGDKFILERL